jgi:hypothetical protein
MVGWRRVLFEVLRENWYFYGIAPSSPPSYAAGQVKKPFLLAL